MPRTGRPAKPTALKILHGDDRKNPQRVNRNEPHPADAQVVPTDDLDVAARQVWDRVAPDLIRQGVLTAWDAEAFTVYCQTVAVYRDAHRSLQDAGLTDRGAAGGVIK
jgi:phage terminase small subunit